MDTLPLSSNGLFVESMWFFEILLGVGTLIVVNFIFTKIIRHIRKKSLSTTTGWKAKIDYIFILPFRILLWILGITLIVEVLSKRFDFSFFDDYLNAFRSSGVVLCLAWILLRWKKELQYHFLNQDRRGKKIDTGFIYVLNKIATITISILSFLIILQIWGLNIVPLIAFGGIGIAAIGFAAKDIIANFFGGLMLYINRPFMIGDFIMLINPNIEGTVEEMGWYLTCVRDKDKRAVYIPNSLFSCRHVINSSRMTHRRIEETIQIQHADFPKIQSTTMDIQNAIASHPDVDTHLPISAVFNSFTPNNINLYIDCYTLETRYEKYLLVKQEIMTRIYNILLKEDLNVKTPLMQIELLDPNRPNL